MQYVLRISDKKVLRYGNCDFANDGAFDIINEEIINTSEIIDAKLFKNNDFTWNGVTFTYALKPIGHKDKLQFGQYLIEMFGEMYGSKTLTEAQHDTALAELEKTMKFLQSGNISQARKKILKLTVDGVIIEQSEVDAAVALIDSFLGL